MNIDTNSINDQPTLFFHSMHVGEVLHVNTARKHLYAKLQTSSHNVKHRISYKIDKGAEGNLLPIRVYQQFFPQCNTISARTKQEISNSFRGLQWIRNQTIR